MWQGWDLSTNWEHWNELSSVDPPDLQVASITQSLQNKNNNSVTSSTESQHSNKTEILSTSNDKHCPCLTESLLATTIERINEAGAKYFVQYLTRLSLFALHGIVR